MDVSEVPQDDSAVFNGERKVLYATSHSGYQAAKSTGWETEEFATTQAVLELERQTASAYLAVQTGKKSPLYFHMFNMRFDEPGLAMAAGMWQWQLRRHFRPEIFARLPEKTLEKYAQAFQISIEDVKQLPK